MDQNHGSGGWSGWTAAGVIAVVAAIVAAYQKWRKTRNEDTATDLKIEKSRLSLKKDKEEWLEEIRRDVVADLSGRLKVIGDEAEKLRREHAQCLEENGKIRAQLSEALSRINILEQRVNSLSKGGVP